nr:MAG TPA: hypothetical protein [Bacteriophage sp.]
MDLLQLSILLLHLIRIRTLSLYYRPIYNTKMCRYLRINQRRLPDS